MRLKVNLKSLTVELVECEWDKLPGAKDNGQHYQLPRFALVEMIGDGCFTLLHPETKPENTGHIDLIAMISTNKGLTLHKYYRNREINPLKDPTNFELLWPEGPANIILMMLAIEKFLVNEDVLADYTLLDFITEKIFCPTESTVSV